MASANIGSAPQLERTPKAGWDRLKPRESKSLASMIQMAGNSGTGSAGENKKED